MTSRTFACSCALEGEGDVTFTCDGNASCDLHCGDQCDIICPGTTGCSAESGASASFECQGNAECEFTCLSDCTVSCGGATRCLVHCDDPDACDLSDCRNAIDCGNDTHACGRPCPTT